MKNNSSKKSYLFTSLIVYFFVFVSIAFILTCCISLFLYDSPLSEEFIRERAPKTFGNIFILSFIFTYVLLLMKYIIFDRHSMKQYEDLLENQQRQEEKLQVDFIANVSHEIKTPLAVISNYVNLLKNENLQKSDSEKYLSVIDEQTKKMSSLVTNILKLNKLENQSYEVAKEKINLSEILCECLISFESIWENKQIDIETDIKENVFINSDSQLLELVFNNLFSNAFKFTNSGGKVFVACSDSQESVFVQITDSGCGISSEIGSHIFEKFYQGDTSHKSEGNGLGLPLVKKIIDVLSGEISVKSIIDEGSTFLIKLQK